MVKYFVGTTLDEKTDKILTDEMARPGTNLAAAQKCMALLLGSPSFQQQ
jgi:hypothetical protein